MLHTLRSKWQELTRRQKVVYILVGLFMLGVISIVGLELAARRCESGTRQFPSCAVLMTRYVYSETNRGNPLDELDVLTQLLSPEPVDLDLDTIVNERIVYVDRNELAELNGITCSSHAFVADDLPDRAKHHVAIHEAIHIQGEYNESRTTYQTTIKEPLGLIELIFDNVVRNLSSVPITEYPCQLGGMWSVFKQYFLTP